MDFSFVFSLYVFHFLLSSLVSSRTPRFEMSGNVRS